MVPESVQARKTAEAFDAVEISDSAPPTPDPPAIPSVRGPDSTLFVYRDEFGNFRLGRREDAHGDEAHGSQLANAIVAAARPSVSRNGELAVFVNAQNDVCLVSTDSSGEGCLGSPGLVHSVSMSPDSQLFGFVLLNAQGNPDNRISVIDLGADEPKTFTLRAPAYDGPGTNTILQADAMDFTLDGQWLVYDALNAVAFSDGSRLRQWSLYALNLKTGTNLALIPPIRGLNIGFPALSQNSDNFLTFDVFDEARNQSTVYTANLNTGDTARYCDGRRVPGAYLGYTGDDSALVFSHNVTRAFQPGFPWSVSHWLPTALHLGARHQWWLRECRLWRDLPPSEFSLEPHWFFRESRRGLIPEWNRTVLWLGV